jgi:serralysin
VYQTLIAMKRTLLLSLLQCATMACCAAIYNPDALYTAGDTITICFLNGSATCQALVKEYAAEWLQYANLHFEYRQSPPANICIRFDTDAPNSWSRLGKMNSLNSEATMLFNFDENDSQTSIKLTVLHEFGHQLSLHHSHQDPRSGLVWNTDEVYKKYGAYGLTREEISSNVLERKVNSKWYGDYDPLSIMHYNVEANEISAGKPVGWNYQLSVLDKKTAAFLYPHEETPFSTHNYITALEKLGEQWFVVGAHHENAIKQVVLKDENITELKKQIKTYWDKNFSITKVSATGKKFVVIMSLGMESNWGQTYNIEIALPEAWIKNKWEEGYRISNIARTNESFFVLMSKPQNPYFQGYSWSQAYPSDTISLYMNMGRNIEEILFTGTKWLVVYGKNPNIQTQVVITHCSFPSETIEEWWAKGYRVSELTYAPGKYVVVMSKTADYDLTLDWSENFPWPHIAANWVENTSE